VPISGKQRTKVGAVWQAKNKNVSTLRSKCSRKLEFVKGSVEKKVF